MQRKLGLAALLIFLATAAYAYVLFDFPVAGTVGPSAATGFLEGDALLLEIGDYLLLENGDKLLLE